MAKKKGAVKKSKKVTVYDTRNQPARSRLQKLANKPGTKFKIQHRMFNGSGHIGHNKFIVYVDHAGTPKSVLTGSTNWTWSGISGQSNNCIRIDDEKIAVGFLAYWQRLHKDKLKVPPKGEKAPDANQGDELKTNNRKAVTGKLPNGGAFECWFSPNMPGKEQPPAKTVKKPPPPPPDMDDLFSLMRKARKAIFFLVFMPSRGGINSIVSEAVNLGLKDTSLNVVGAISDTQAMWGYEASRKTESGAKISASSPHVFQQNGVSVVRATALTDKEIGRELGDFRLAETLTVGRAIIHDKILVLDPLDPDNCVVAFGSHNLGYKASYSNDENSDDRAGASGSGRGLRGACAGRLRSLSLPRRRGGGECRQEAEGGQDQNWQGETGLGRLSRHHRRVAAEIIAPAVAVFHSVMEALGPVARML